MTNVDDGNAQQVTEFVVAIFSDVREAERDLKEEDSPFRRRAYVRATFASVEGFVFTLKKVALTRPDLFQAGELVLLREEEYVLTDKGDVRSRPRFLRAGENLRFAFRAFMRLHGSADFLESDDGWAAFQRAVEIRNRVTHPKSIHHLSITDDDIHAVRYAAHWLALKVLMSVAAAMGSGAVLLVILFLVGWGLMKPGAGASATALPERRETD